MQNYQFSMEKILDWRIKQEDEAQQEVISLKQKVEQEELTLDRLVKESRRIKNDSMFSSTIDSFKQHNLYKDLIDDQIVKQRLTLEQVKKELLDAQEKLLLKHKDKKVMEKLDEKERSHHNEFWKKEEQKQLDEISSLQYGHNPSSV